MFRIQNIKKPLRNSVLLTSFDGTDCCISEAVTIWSAVTGRIFPEFFLPRFMRHMRRLRKPIKPKIRPQSFLTITCATRIVLSGVDPFLGCHSGKTEGAVIMSSHKSTESTFLSQKSKLQRHKGELSCCKLSIFLMLTTTFLQNSNEPKNIKTTYWVYIPIDKCSNYLDPKFKYHVPKAETDWPVCFLLVVCHQCQTKVISGAILFRQCRFNRTRFFSWEA